LLLCHVHFAVAEALGMNIGVQQTEPRLCTLRCSERGASGSLAWAGDQPLSVGGRMGTYQRLSTIDARAALPESRRQSLGPDISQNHSHPMNRKHPSDEPLGTCQLSRAHHASGALKTNARCKPRTSARPIVKSWPRAQPPVRQFERRMAGSSAP